MPILEECAKCHRKGGYVEKGGLKSCTRCRAKAKRGDEDEEEEEEEEEEEDEDDDD